MVSDSNGLPLGKESRGALHATPGLFPVHARPGPSSSSPFSSLSVKELKLDDEDAKKRQPINCSKNSSCPRGLTCTSCVDGHKICLSTNSTGQCCGCEISASNYSCWFCATVENCQISIPNYCDTTNSIADGNLSPIAIAIIVVSVVVGLGMFSLGCCIALGVFDKDLRREEEIMSGPPVVVFSGNQKKPTDSSGKGEISDLHGDDLLGDESPRANAASFVSPYATTPAAGAPAQHAPNEQTPLILTRPTVKYIS